VDGHNDLPWAVGDRAGHDLDRLDPGQQQPELQTDLPRLAAGGVGVQFWSVYVSAELSGGDAVAATLEQIDFVRRLCARHPDRLRLVRTAVQARKAFAAGRIASLMGAEGGHSIGGSIAVLRVLAQVADHIEHVREVAGIAHVGLGGDYDGVAQMPVGLADVSCYPALLAELADRGWSDRELAALAGGNALRVLAVADEAAERAVGADNIG
jgi:microsomal dipeptidase-like Zn-dependent dipeptidase